MNPKGFVFPFAIGWTGGRLKWVDGWKDRPGQGASD